MKNIMHIALVLGIVLVFAGVAVAAHPGVGVAEKPGVGTYITDSHGMSLYWFKKDTPGNSACAGSCTEKWPVFYNEAGSLKAGDFGSIKRADGKMQTTFRGYPLYYFFKDKKAGDTNGHAVNDVWYLVPSPPDFPMK